MTNKRLDKKTNPPHFIIFLFILFGLLLIGPLYFFLPHNTDLINFITISLALTISFFIIFSLHKTYQPPSTISKSDLSFVKPLPLIKDDEVVFDENNINQNDVPKHHLESKKSIQKLSKSQVNRILRIRHKLTKDLPQESKNALDEIIDLFNYFNNEAYIKLGNNIKLIKKLQKIQQKTFRDIKK